MAGLRETGLPEALYEPLFARLRASANVVLVVEAAAVIGRQTDSGLLCAVVDLTEEEVDDVIDELEDAQVLGPWSWDEARSCGHRRGKCRYRCGVSLRYYSNVPKVLSDSMDRIGMEAEAAEAATFIPEDPDGLATVVGFLATHERLRGKVASPSYALVGIGEHDRIELPRSVHQALTKVVAALHAGKAVTIAPQTMKLTTQQAADLWESAARRWFA